MAAIVELVPVRSFVVGLSVLAGACTRHAEHAASPAPRHVVMISIDGLRADALRDPDAHGLKVPTLRALVARGAMAEGVTSVFPTVTYPAHATLVTGVRPARHGILNNLPFDPLGKNLDGWMWYARDVRVPTLWDVADAQGLTTANVYWPVTVGAKVRWSFPQIWRARNDEDDKLMAALATPGLFDEVRARYGRTPAEHRGDDARADAAELLLETKRPDLAFVYFTDLDTEEHKSGPFSPAANAVLETIDAQVARLVRATERAGTFASTTFVVVSDHGFLPISKLVKPNVLLHAAGLLDVDASGRVSGYRAAAWKAGGTCAIVLHDPNDPQTKLAVTTLFREAMSHGGSGIGKVLEGDAIAARGGFTGATLVLEAADGFAFSPATIGDPVEDSVDKGTHGYLEERPEMRATLVMAGSGVRAGARLGVVSMTDVAPTVARLLGLALADVDGKPLDAALAP